MSCVYQNFTFETWVYVEDPALKTDAKLEARGNAWKLTMNKGTAYTLRTQGIYQRPIWSSKKSAIAFVDENGTVYARKKGTTIVSTKINKKPVKIYVTVTE